MKKRKLLLLGVLLCVLVIAATAFYWCQKPGTSMSINAEYNYLPGDQVVSSKVYKSLSFGMDVETGGHVFQLIFTISRGMIGPYYLAKTTGTWADGNVYFGFNISWAFNFKRKE